MANEINIYEPRYLAEAVRTAPPICTFLRDRFFSKVKTFPTKNVDIDIVKGNRKMAAFVHPMVGGEIVQNEGYETKSYAPPLINPATVTTADMFLQRLPGEDIYSGRTPADRAAEKLTEEYNKLNDMTTRREEWMAAQVLTTGQLKVKGKGVDEVIDFGFTNKINLEGTKQWGKSAADTMGNLREWKRQVSRNGFANANIYKSITVDNGSEFALADQLEQSCITGDKRTKVYYCHPYSSWERGSNENVNGMIRRRHPKGTDFSKVTAEEIAATENWINSYPRKIFGYKSAGTMFRECLRELGLTA